jgi:hypothetical protein
VTAVTRAPRVVTAATPVSLAYFVTADSTASAFALAQGLKSMRLLMSHS